MSLTTPCLGQGPTGKAETSGACSPAVTGNNNQFTITCQGIPEKLRAQIVELPGAPRSDFGNLGLGLSVLPAIIRMLSA